MTERLTPEQIDKLIADLRRARSMTAQDAAAALAQMREERDRLMSRSDLEATIEELRFRAEQAEFERDREADLSRAAAKHNRELRAALDEKPYLDELWKDDTQTWQQAYEQAEQALERLAWQPIETAPKGGTCVLVALIRDGKIWRVSDAVFSGLGWYTKNGGVACHWRTHWMPLPEPTPDALTRVLQPGEKKDARCFDCGCPPHEGICPECGHRHVGGPRWGSR